MERKMQRAIARLKQAAGDAGDGGASIAGHGISWGYLNDYNRVFVPGAFVESLGEISEQAPLPIGWMHEIPIGKWADVHEDEIGLYLDGRISATSTGQDAAILIRDGLNALSVGFWPLVIQYAEPGERCSFETPYGTRAYQFDEYVLYIVKAELAECSFVFVPADDTARIEAVQSLVTRVRQQLPGLAAGASWEQTASSMAALLTEMPDLPELERQALHARLAVGYAKYDRTPPSYAPAGAAVTFAEGEAALFAGRQLQDAFNGVRTRAAAHDGALPAGARAEAQAAIAELQDLVGRESLADRLTHLNASLRETTQTLKKTETKS